MADECPEGEDPGGHAALNAAVLARPRDDQSSRGLGACVMRASLMTRHGVNPSSRGSNGLMSTIDRRRRGAPGMKRLHILQLFLLAWLSWACGDSTPPSVSERSAQDLVGAGA